MQNFSCQPQTLEGEEGGGGGEGGVAPLLLRCTAVLSTSLGGAFYKMGCREVWPQIGRSENEGGSTAFVA